MSYTSKRSILGVALLVGTFVAALVPALSHAGASATNGEIAFSAGNEHVSQVFTVEPNGSHLVQVTHAKSPGAGEYGLGWSPDGRHLIYAVNHHGKDRIVRSQPDGAGATVLSPPCTGTCLGDDNPDYSPNGKRIVFERAFRPIVKGNASLALFTINADGSDLKQLTPKSRSSDSQAHWSPDGTEIAFVHFDSATSEQAIEVMDADGKNIRRLTPYQIDAGNPRWSSSGKLLLYNTYGEPVQYQSANLFTMHPDGTHRVQLTHYNGGTQQARADDWSPDGTEVLFRRFKFTGSDSEVGGYYILDLNGDHVRRLVPTRITSDEEAAWGRKP